MYIHHGLGHGYVTMADANMMLDDHDDTVSLGELGTDDPCKFSDDEDEDHGQRCAICKKSSGQIGDFMDTLVAFHNDHIGHVKPDVIYELCAEYYETEFKANMMAGGEKVANLTKLDIKRHFEKHYTSPLADVVKDIRTLQMIQHELRYHGIRTRHSVTGGTTMDPQKIKLFLSCSKMKMDLYSKLKSLRKDMPKNKKAAPQKFFTQEW